MNIDAAKWFADYDKIIDFASLGLTGKEFVLAYDINNPAMYEKLVRHSETLLVLDDKDFFARWQKKLEIDALLKKDEDVPTLVVCDTIAEAIEELGKGSSGRVVGLVVDGRPEEFCKAFVKEWERRNMKKSDLIIMNPPYAGKGNPLFMKISNVIYENFLSDTGRLVSINPTSVVDKTIYSDNDEDAPYSNMRVSDFVFSDEFSDVFDGADIKTGIGIFTYSKEGHSLYSDWIREKRFGKDEWKFRKTLIDKIFTEYTIGRIPDFFSVVDSDPKERVRKSSMFESLYKNKYFVIISQLTGGKKKGKINWDWLTLHSKDYLKVMKTLPDIHYHGIPFDSKDDAINLIKWINTDFVMYVLNHYKFNVSNTKTILDRIPSFTLLNGDFSDANICKVFSITHDEMSVIHNDMKDFGNKFHLGKTEAQLMEYIDEINS